MTSKDAPPSTSSSSAMPSTSTNTEIQGTTSTGIEKSPSVASPSASSTISSSSAATDSTTFTPRTELFSSPVTYSLKDGEFLHDIRDGDKTLMEYANHVGAMNVFDVFFDYTRVITQDVKQAANAFKENPSLNRYNDIRCIDATRVSVPTSDGKDYLHANFVDGYREEKKFILTQAPLEATIERFWEMVWQQNSTMVVSLTPLDGESCPAYVPIASGESKEYGKIKVANMGTRNVRDSYDSTLLMISKEGMPARQILHIIFYAWPDKETPTRPSEILYFIEDINFNRNVLLKNAKDKEWLDSSSSKSPIIVLGKSGVGPSGTLVAMDICMQKLDDTFKRACGPCLNVRDTVLRLRTQRAMAVQKPEQYLFIHLALFEYAIRKRYFENIEDLTVNQFICKKPKK